ncbi:MAG: hypothetical protein ACLQVI_25930 [Polyangiaceae bacterium]|jgi:hypothetical protein
MILVVLVTIGSVINVFADDSAVRAAAEAVACPRGCTKASSVRVERSPIAETVEYEMPGGMVTVHCIRAAVLVGPYSCTKE